jgi:hypothetical protein
MGHVRRYTGRAPTVKHGPPPTRFCNARNGGVPGSNTQVRALDDLLSRRPHWSTAASPWRRCCAPSARRRRRERHQPEHAGDRGLAGPYASAQDRPAPENGPCGRLSTTPAELKSLAPGRVSASRREGVRGFPRSLTPGPSPGTQPRPRNTAPRCGDITDPAEPTTSHTPTAAPPTRRAAAPQPLEPSPTPDPRPGSA